VLKQVSFFSIKNESAHKNNAKNSMCDSSDDCEMDQDHYHIDAMNKSILKQKGTPSTRMKRNVKSFNFTPEQFNSLVNTIGQKWPGHHILNTIGTAELWNSINVCTWNINMKMTYLKESEK